MTQEKQPLFKPVIAIVGRANVGKSTLFNRLTRSRQALVADFPGLTRDRHYGEGRGASRPYLVVDTGGFEPIVKDGIKKEMADQTEQAISEADVVIFLVDVRDGLHALDFHIADRLRRTGQIVLLAVNKAEGMRDTAAGVDFYELGLGEPHLISSAHGDGVADLIERALDRIYDQHVAQFPEVAHTKEDTTSDEPEHRVRLAVVGRPNVGKSTFINQIIGEERLVAFNEPGTTRDAIEIEFNYKGVPYTFVDTAGIRRRGRVTEAIEKFSVIKTLQAIEAANVVLLILDAQAEISEQDANIAGFIVESGRALVVAINKWDGLDDYTREWVLRDYRRKLRFLDFARMHTISAQERHGLAAVMRSVRAAHQAAFTKMSTPVLTRIIHQAVEQQPPPRRGHSRPKLRYAHQGGQNPPVVVIHGTALNEVPESYRRYIEGQIRNAFKLEGTPLRIEFRTAHNPYAREK
ncbi:MAG TPA: ribosome biogenesis GTPase Der [Paenalcaligenes sp.]|nr:ribosome biogenesis GTPase Der [Paenalcaligenes sp.]